MSGIKFIISKNSGQLSLNGKTYTFPENCLVITNDEAIIVESILKNQLLSVDFDSSSLHKVYPEIINLLLPQEKITYSIEPIRIIRAERNVLDVFTYLLQLSEDNFLHFAYTYCLGLDNVYFSSLLYKYISGNKDFCSFIENHFMRQWSVVRLAQEFDLPVRKFNELFLCTYGQTAKRWLLERRIKHAKKLLSTTSMRVIDIAIECGFSSHAHFTDRFRRYINCSPKQFRNRSLQINSYNTRE
ncbi:helix-turn-helix transcriptional regulator [Providencia vermicola]|nr:helix-turn-helix domain-containing protein [Providencia sp. G1(2023)]MBC8654959.1 helix-turn-helix transcriptional regulator [Providencia vermicola]